LRYSITVVLLETMCEKEKKARLLKEEKRLHCHGTYTFFCWSRTSG